MEKKNIGIIVLVVILSISVLLLSGYIVYDKILLDNDGDNNNTNNNGNKYSSYAGKYIGVGIDYEQDELYIELKADGTYFQVYDAYTYYGEINGTFEINGSTLVLSNPEDTWESTFIINNNELTVFSMNNEDGEVRLSTDEDFRYYFSDIMVYRKQ